LGPAWVASSATLRTICSRASIASTTLAPGRQRRAGRPPHLLRHALASAMAANKEPASIIAAQLRHADGGALAQRVYIHQLPQTAPRLAELIEDVYGPAVWNTQATSALRPAEGIGGNPALQAAMTGYVAATFR
jgi:hypothetical protein